MSQSIRQSNGQKRGARLRCAVAFLCALLVSVGGFFGCQQENPPLQSGIIIKPDGDSSSSTGGDSSSSTGDDSSSSTGDDSSSSTDDDSSSSTGDDSSSSTDEEDTDEWEGYTAEEKNGAVNTLRSMINRIKAQVLGSAQSYSQALSDGLNGGVAACERRKISKKDFAAIVDLICAREELITQLVLQGVENSSQEGNENALTKEITALFSEFSALLGAEPASRLFYDFTLLFCGYKQSRCLELYNLSSLNVYLKERKAWKDRKEGLGEIGEDNFDCLVRGVFLFAGDYESGGEILGGFTSGDVALFLRAQGDLLSRLQMTEQNWSFLLRELGNLNDLPALSAMLAADDVAGYAEKASDLTEAIANSLSQMKPNEVSALTGGEPMGYLYCVSAKWEDGQWNAFEDFLSAGGGEEKYAKYFEQEGLTEAYAQFKQSVIAVTITELRAANEKDFGESFKNYLATVNAALAFTVFGI